MKRKIRRVLLIAGLCLLPLLLTGSSPVIYCDRCPTCDAPGILIGRVPRGGQYVAFFHDAVHFWWCAYIDGKLKTVEIPIK
jgi:hypothetical protein